MNAFNAIGFIAVFVQDKLSPFLPRIFEQIRLSIASTKDTLKKKQMTSSDPFIFNCLTLLTKYVGIETFSYIRSIIDQVLTSGLSYNLVIALNEIVKQIPELKRDVEDGLHKQLSIILIQKSPPNILDFPRPIELPSTPVLVSDPQLTILALNTLSKFEFSRYVTESFLKFITAGYLESKFIEIRLTATRTVVLLLSPFIKIFNNEPFKHKEKAALELIREIMNKLMALCVTDKNQEVRLCVLRSLMADDIYYIHLAQAEILQLIFVALQDESFEMRQFVVCSLGKLSEVNPAIIMPVLRRVLIQILNELNFNGLNRNEERSAKLLSQLIFSAPKFMKPYVPSTLKVLVDKLNSTAPNQTDVIINVLHALGELVNVGGLDFIKEQENLTPLLIEFMQDPNSLEKREVRWRR
uniref:Uncharacterized protein n=1 Tax=Romanomermis culicivorax TaxID=13658 RepID=A0A915JWW1_ROMCU